MGPNIKHKAFIGFIRKVLAVPGGHSKEELIAFRNTARNEYPSAVPIIDQYLDLAERSETEVPESDYVKPGKPRRNGSPPGQMHLFDLLRDKRLFASNNDLASFAIKILPNIRGQRFPKMSRGDIAARIIEYLESRDRRTRENLESSMREAIQSPEVKPADRKSFLSKWEAIIKGIEL